MSSPGWTDEPVTTREADDFGRDGFARHVARLVSETHSWESSTVFGLTGPWGSGKTSLISLIETAFNDPHQPVDSDYEVVWFTPWAAQDVGGLLGEFFSALAKTFPRRKGKTARKAFARLLAIAAPTASVIPIAGAAVTATAEAVAEALVSKEPWDQAFEDATKRIRIGGKKILVVVDDVDRLQTNELLAVLKVVRLLGRFPGVQYLLAYDHDSLIHTLINASAAKNTAAARRYIEKMIQYPVPIPALIGAQIDTLVNQQLEALIAHHRPNFLSPLNGVRDLAPTIRATLSTPRAIGRYVAQLHYELGLHLDGETDVEDTIVLTLLRTAYPELYNNLPRYQHELVTGLVYKTAHDTASADERFATDILVDGLDSADRTHALLLLQALFPKLRSEHEMARRKSVPGGLLRPLFHDDYSRSIRYSRQSHR
ncbi:hypothetical protein CH300_18735 [Rhodococcus sp. 15-1154-1]|nr:KAP family NTPase [Rhodococcus sp. 15-1154-1]OZF01006.1 hypothetical protein CH300_18735 [Rhodococcus sp. 15-1154-1]